MNDAQQASQSIGKFLQTLRGLAELKPGLESLGSVQQAEQEVKSRLSALGIDENSLRNKVGQLRAEVGELEKKREASKAQAKVDSDAEIKRAKNESDKYHAATIASVKEVEGKASDKLVALDEKIVDAEAKLSEIRQQTKSANASLLQVQGELDRIVQRAGGR